ncbi:MAG: sensor histidine kinase [Cyanobacteria bacterium J06638_28]
MKDLGQALEEKVEIVTESWIRAVSQDSEIESARRLAYEAVRNSLPEVLEELSQLLSRYQSGDPEELEDKSLYHGFVRAQQGYDTAEIVREYRLLRQVVLGALEPELLTGTPRELLSAVRVIDDILDEIVTLSLERYIEARLTELRQMQSQLTLTNQELTRLIQAQQENLSFMAHELKTPLNSIIGHSSVLLRQQRRQLQERDTTTNLDQIEKVLRNGRRLLQIINDTLEISRYNEGQIQLNLATVDVGALIQEIIEDGLEPLAAEKELQLEIDVSQAPASLITDALRIQQLVTNLVSNAIRYTESGSVRVQCRQIDGENWEIAVADTGIGIVETDRTAIFDPYVRSDSETRAIAGTGLGLAIVKRIVTLMNGSIEVTSEVGVGSTFTISLPLIQPVSDS